MPSKLVLVLFSIALVHSSVSNECYWNRKCPYELFGAATPYDTIRGDLRDQIKDNDCEVISIWSIHRHGNRNPRSDVMRDGKELQRKIKLLLDVPENRRSHNCAQDLDELVHWKWNSTMDNATSYLTGVGYEEIYHLGRRLRMQYKDFVNSVEEVHFRATNSQRTETSLAAFVRGLTHDETMRNFSSAIEPPREKDNVIWPYEICARYQEEMKQQVVKEMAAYDTNAEYIAIQDKVQAKLFVDYKLTLREVYTLYELCRFDRTWRPKLRSPWCSFFTDQDLMVLEYRDDAVHYYKNGYGMEINAILGAQAMKNLYETFINASQGNQTSMVSYFSHDTMLEMIYCALGLYKDREPLTGSIRNRNRLWKSSQFSAFSSNFIAVLSKCVKSSAREHRVQILINERPTTLCPEEGCTWQQFLDRFQVFSTANMDPCAAYSPLSGKSEVKTHKVTSLMPFVMMFRIL